MLIDPRRIYSEYTLHDAEYGLILIVCGKNFRLALFSYFQLIENYISQRFSMQSNAKTPEEIAEMMAPLREVPIRACKYVTSKVSRALS